MTRILVAIMMVLAASIPALSQELVTKYFASLSTLDHFSADATPLTTAADIIARDREIFHQFKTPDDLDEGDDFFSSAENRALVAEMLDRGNVPADVRSDIVEFQMTAVIEVWNGADGPFLTVELLK